MRLSKIIEILENKAIAFYKKNKDSIPRYILILFIVLYAAGFVVHSVTTGLHNFYSGSNDNLFIIDPVKNIKALFTPAGIGTVLFGFLMFLLFSGKGKDLLSGYKTVKDKERGIEILPEGTHGTSGFMDKKELPEFLVSGSIEKVDETLFGKLENGDYVAMKDMPGMSKNVMVYGAPGTGKSRGFVMPFVMQATRRGESLVMVDPKAEFYEMYSGFLNSRGYTVKAYNLLDLFASDGWNCVMDTAKDITLVQRAAEIIIRNTSNENERGDFWEKAEKNLLMALLHYVQTLTYPGTDKLLPPEERSLGTIYKILSTTSVQELDARFRALPPDHPALPPYGIFRQAHKQIWGNIVIGLGNRLNVFQNKLVDDITKHNEIDLTLPGREKCAYFCIISDQDSSLEFLSSMFFSLMFVKLFDYARQQDNRRLPVCVNVLMDEFCNIALLDSKKIFSVARSRNINIQAVVQSIAQLSDRYPGNEWQEIVGDCDYQLFLGCNDVMTSEFFSKQCGEITVRVNNTNTPMRPFLDFLSPQKPYMQNKTSTGRALMLPDEIRRLPKDKAILLVRGAKPLLLNKITPEEHPSFKLLKYCKAAEHIPAWKLKKPEKVKNKKVPQYKMQFEMPLDTDEDEKESFDLSDGIAPDSKGKGYIMNRTYRLSDVVNERFLRLPLSLFANPNYKRLSAESKLVYSLLLDRMSLSQKNNWINEDGEVYLIYKREEIADILCITYKKAIAAFKELIAVGLLLEKRQGRGFPNRLFVLKCELEDSDAGDFGSSFDNPETDEKEPENPQDTQMCENGISKADESACLNIPDTQLKNCQNGTSRTAVLTHQEVPKRQSIQTNNNYIKNIYTECNQSTDPALAAILQNCELKSFESKTAQMLESAVRVLYYKQSIKLSGAVLPQTEIRNLLRKVNRDTLIDAVEVLRHNENEVQNPQGYLYSVILNAVNAEHTSTLLELPDNMIDREMLYASD